MTVWNYDPLTKDLVKASDLLSGDVVAIYPARLDRGKQPEKIIRLMKGVKKAGYEPRLLIVDWQSAGSRFQKYIDEMIALTKSMHIEECVSFTSRLDNRCSQGIPHHVVLELMDLSNIYVHPSRVETYSLTTHEAATRGKLLILNHDLPASREIFGDHAIYMDFSSDYVDREYAPTEQAFWNDEALRILAELKQNRALWAQTVARREWSPQAMWKDFETLLYLRPIGE
jgi:glycosyltransferase involved in cell wall biosynthesis